jgi:hypothetical protein
VGNLGKLADTGSLLNRADLTPCFEVNFPSFLYNLIAYSRAVRDRRNWPFRLKMAYPCLSNLQSVSPVWSRIGSRPCDQTPLSIILRNL